MGSIAMDSVSMNHYEKQLYTVFKTFDVDNEEALNKSAVLQLCDALQLEDRGVALVDTLFDRRADRVTFAQFRNGLLSVLGGGASAASAPTAAASGVPASDDDSSGREVAPKFVFGSKKYGRRSRPQRSPATPDESPSPRAASVSRLDTDNKKARNSQRMRYRRSTSAMDTHNRDSDNNSDRIPNGFDHDQRVNHEQALDLCYGLQMDGIDQNLVKRIFQESPTGDMTIGEFFDQLNTSLTSSLERTQCDNIVTHRDIDDTIEHESGSDVPSTLIIHAWENSGVPHSQRLLNELGFTSSVLSLPELERALDDELRSYGEPLDENCDSRILFLVAALELCRLLLKRARKHTEIAVAERDKLRADVAEANRRACLLAQDNDESHARLEAELAASVRQAEARLAEASRLAAADAAAERELAAATNAKLNAELTQYAMTERCLREQIEAQNLQIVKLESRASEALARAEVAEFYVAETRAAQLRATPDNETDRSADGEVQVLTEQLGEMRRENEALRDRNDELYSLLERRPQPAATAMAAGGDLSAELAGLLPAALQECDSAPASISQRTVSWAEAGRRLAALAAAALLDEPAAACAACRARDARLAALHAQLADLGEELAPAPAPRPDTADAPSQTDRAPGPADELERTHDDEKLKLSEYNKELEANLEQMKLEYDKCEEYWSAKLAEERAAHGEELRLGDERLADLVDKIHEYERQFAPARLPAIDERAALEAQVNDLEAEFASYRARAEAEARAREARLARLAARLEARGECACAALAERCARLAAAGGAGAREAAGLRARAARAEAAVQRLHARLAAADLLVKDLYVENCQLAHRRPL